MWYIDAYKSNIHTHTHTHTQTPKLTHRHTNTHTQRPSPLLPAPSFVNQPDKQKHKVPQVTGSWDPVIPLLPSISPHAHTHIHTHKHDTASYPNPQNSWILLTLNRSLSFCCEVVDSSCAWHARNTFLSFSSPLQFLLSFPPLPSALPLFSLSFFHSFPSLPPSNITPGADTERDPAFIVAAGQRRKHRAGTVTPVIKERMFSVKRLRGEWSQREKDGGRGGREAQSQAREIKSFQRFHSWRIKAFWKVRRHKSDICKAFEIDTLCW